MSISIDHLITAEELCHPGTRNLLFPQFHKEHSKTQNTFIASVSKSVIKQLLDLLEEKVLNYEENSSRAEQA
ncbi:unnamed protein product [Coregonus sp. 'balchen']|nr:unnamed protein product [Coregonus sp. 'balchen']